MLARLAAGLAVLALALVPLRATSSSAEAADPSVFSGLGTWVSIFGTTAYSQPEAVAAQIAGRGIKTAYLETANYTQRVDIVRPEQLGRLVDALHARGVRVVAWYLPGFVKPAVDERRSLAAIRFRTPTGGAFDGFALDIESTAVRRPGLRTQRVLTLSRTLRSAAGLGYPLGAIIPSPRGIELKPTYWPGFPFAQLAEIYDTFLPMVYWTYHVNGPDGAYGYLARALAILRDTTDNTDVSIHLVGGTSYRATLDEQRSFAQLVVDDGRLTGWSLYDWFGTKPAVFQLLTPISRG